MNKLTQEGIRLFQAGEKQKAARILASALQRDTHDEEAWYWLSACVDDLEKKRYCLRRVLHINPANAKARRRLSRLDDLPEPESIAPSPYAPNNPIRYKRIGAVILGLMVLMGSILLVSSLRMSKPAEGDLAVVLGELDEIPQPQLTETTAAADLLPVEQIPVTGSPVTISGSGSLETDPFALPAKKIKFIWQYSGHPDEEKRLEFVFLAHQSRIEQIEEDYSVCMKEKQALLNLAIIRQDTAEISKVENDIESCIEQYEKEKRSQSSSYYDNIDAITTKITIKLHRLSSGTPVTLVEKQGIYYGISTFEVNGGEDYYLEVVSSGEWSVKFE
jgi:hypothetical protein